MKSVSTLHSKSYGKFNTSRSAWRRRWRNTVDAKMCRGDISWWQNQTQFATAATKEYDTIHHVSRASVPRIVMWHVDGEASRQIPRARLDSVSGGFVAHAKKCGLRQYGDPRVRTLFLTRPSSHRVDFHAHRYDSTTRVTMSRRTSIGARDRLLWKQLQRNVMGIHRIFGGRTSLVRISGSIKG